MVLLLLLLACLLPAPVLLAQELEPPPGWTTRAEPGVLVFTPGSLAPGQEVRMGVHDPEPGGEELEGWLRWRLGTLPLDPGVAEGCRPRLVRPVEASCVVNGPGGDHYLHAVRLDSGEHRLVHVLIAPNTLSGVRHILSLQRIMNGAQAGLGRGAAHAAEAPPVPSPPLPGGGEAQTPGDPAAANRSDSPDWIQRRIEAVVLNLEYRTGVGGGIYPSYIPYILLQDGTVTGDLSVVPMDQEGLDAWRRGRPREWGEWTRRGDGFVLVWNEGGRSDTHIENWHAARAASASTRLEGYYRSIGGGGNTALGGDVTMAAWSHFDFGPDGSVETGGGAAGISGGGGTGGSVTTRAPRPTRQGRYRVKDWFIHLDLDGEGGWHWFYLYPDSDNALGIGGSTLSRSRSR